MIASDGGAAAVRILDSAGPDRPWLVLVHGASQDSGLFSGQIDAFQSDFRLALVDLPGHGASSAIHTPYGLVEYAGAVVVGLDAAGVQDAHYWGTHTGAGIGLLLALEQPRRFRSLVLEGAVIPGHPMPYVMEMLTRAREVAAARGVSAARQVWFNEGAWFDVIRARPEECRADEQREMLARFAGGPWLDPRQATPLASMVDRLPDLSTPTLIVNGERDVGDFVAVADLLEARIPRGRRLVVEDAGGFPQWEFPDRVNGPVLAFLEDVDQDRV